MKISKNLKVINFLKLNIRLGSILSIFGFVLSMNTFAIQAEEAQDSDAQQPEAEEANKDEALGLPNDNVITVTASRREENIQDLAQSVSALSGDTLKAMGASDLEDYIRSIPGVQFTSRSPGSMDISIRGVRALGAEPVGGATIGYYIDDMPIPTAFDFPDVGTFDMSRVEVLRGPQGTLFGEGSLGGTIRSITNKPSTDGVEFEFEGTYAGINEGSTISDVKAMVNIPLGDDAALRLVGFSEDRGGFLDNPYLGLAHVNDYKSTGGRAMLQWEPSQDLTILASAHIRNSEFGAKSQGNADLLQSASFKEEGIDDYEMYNLSVTYAMSDKVEFLSSTSYFDRDAPRISDLGPLIPTVQGAAVFYTETFWDPSTYPVFTSVYTDNTKTFEMLTQEFRVQSTEDGPLKWSAGVFYKDLKLHEGFNGLSTPDVPVVLSTVEIITEIPVAFFPGLGENFRFDEDVEVQQIALFGEVSYEISDKLEALVGLRLFKEERHSVAENSGLFLLFLAGALPNNFVLDDSAKVVNPKLTLNYKFSDDMLGYATAAKGFRSGGLNEFAAFFPGADAAFDPEELWSYELGLKSSWLDNKAIVNGSLFYLDWSDLIAPVAAIPAIPLQDNVGDARTIGADILASFMPVNGLQINLGLSWLDAETTDEMVLLSIPYAEGQPIPGVPELSYNASVSYSDWIMEDLLGSFRVDFTHTGESDATFSGDVINPSYSLINVSYSIESKNWDARLFVNNATDKRALTGFWSTDTLTGLGDQYFMNRPRTAGLTIRYRY